MFEGYWISPSGTTYDVPFTHIDFIVKNPYLFGYTRDELQMIADRHCDRLEDEGASRNQVMTDLLKMGWIRVRYDRQREWVLQIWTLSKKVLDNLLHWLNSMLDESVKGAKRVYQNTQMSLMVLKAGNNSITASVGDIFSGKIYEILRKAKTEGIIIIEDDVNLD